MNDVNEKILNAWIMMNSAIDDEHIVTSMPYNEAIVCNILSNNKDKEVTATDLCEILNMQKSQMNRTLTSLEEQNLIERVRLDSDKRKIILKLVEDPNNIYHTQHQKNINYINNIVNEIGQDKAQEIIDIFNKIARIAKEKK